MGHAKASQRPSSLQTMSPALERKYTAPPPDSMRYKLLEIERKGQALLCPCRRAHLMGRY